MSKTKEELLAMLKANFERDNHLNPGSMNWRSVYLATVDNFHSKQYAQAKTYVNDLSLRDLRTCRELLEDFFIDEFLDKIRSHLSGVRRMSSSEIETYEAEMNQLLSDEKLNEFNEKQDRLLEEFSKSEQGVMVVVDQAEEKRLEEALKPRKPNKKKHDPKN